MAILEGLLLLVEGIILGDAEAIALAAVVALATAWSVWRRNRVALLVRVAIFANVLFWMAPGAIINLAGHEQPAAIFGPMALALASVVGLVASAGYLLRYRRQDADRPAVTVVAGVGVVALLAGAAVSVVQSPIGSNPLGGNNVAIRTHQAKFSTASLAASAGAMTVDVANDDLFWHTFTIDQLGVDVRVPVRAHSSVTFSAARGAYTYRCAIPGHESIGMKGTLTVR